MENNLMLVFFRDPAVASISKDLGFTLVPQGESEADYGAIRCTRVVPEWGGAFLALTVEAEEDDQSPQDNEAREELLVPTHSVLVVLHASERRGAGFAAKVF